MLNSDSMLSGKTLQTVSPLLYLTGKIKNAVDDMVHTGGLLYLADKYHLLWYGRTVTRDEHIYTQGIPIGKIAFDLSGTWTDSLYKFYKHKLSEDDILDRLSKTDREALDFVINTFGAMPHGKLYDYVHSLPEWKKVEDLFQLKDAEGKSRIKMLPVEPLDLFLLPDSDCYFNVSAEHIEQSRQMMTGEFD